MSLQTFNNVEQGSEQWLELRRGTLTASVMGQFVTPSTLKVANNEKVRSIMYQLVAERITGVVEDRYVSAEMEMGHVIEPIARDLYSQHYAPVIEVGFMVRDEFAYRIGYSPDGLVQDDGLIEVKMHIPKLHLQTILNDRIPTEHVAQCQTGLFVTGRRWLDYISFCGGMPMWVKRIHPDPEWFKAIELAATTFEDTAKQWVDQYRAATRGLPATERINYFAGIEIEL